MSKRLILIFVVFALLSGNLFGAGAGVILDKITVNGVNHPNLNPESFVFGTSDKIEIFYHLNDDSKSKVPFRFIVDLKFQDQNYSQPTNTKSIIYSNLQENNYNITISALDPNNMLNAIPLQFTFRINDREVQLMKQLEQSKAKAAKADSAMKSSNMMQNGDFFSGANAVKNIIGILFGLVLIALAIYIIRKNFKNTGQTKNNINENKEINNHKGNITMNADSSSGDIQALKLENADLKKEIEALRQQIDNMSVRSSELSKQNTELKDKSEKLAKFNSELEELQKQKDDLFAMVIHDIKNPAGLVKSLVELLNSYDLSASEQKEIIADIMTTTSKIVSLSQEVTKILSLESNSICLNIDDYDINEIVKDVARRNTINADKKQIEIITELKTLPPIPIDAQKVEEVIDNLVSNAVKFSPKGAKVKISVKKEGDMVEVAVKDNGLGLSQEDISKAFQRGVRLSASPTDNEHSSGFGLWIVKKLVEAHNGRVKITSALGKGSTFMVLFPMKQIKKAEISAPLKPDIDDDGKFN